MVVKEPRGWHSILIFGTRICLLLTAEFALIFDSQRPKTLAAEVLRRCHLKQQRLGIQNAEDLFWFKDFFASICVSQSPKMLAAEVPKRWHPKCQRLAIKSSKDLQLMKEVVALIILVIQQNGNF